MTPYLRPRLIPIYNPNRNARYVPLLQIFVNKLCKLRIERTGISPSSILQDFLPKCR